MTINKLQSKFALIDDINIHYMSASPAHDKVGEAKTFVFLHGFPEYWQTWQAQLEYFADQYHVIAPDLPGYNLSDKPLDTSFYQVPNLIEFIVKFIEKVSPTQTVYLVAHDWGGAIAWPLAAFYPHFIDKLIILNAAHPSTFTREMINNSLQREKSTYIHELIGNDAEELLSKNDYLYLRNKMELTATLATFSQEVLARYKTTWQQPNAVRSMLQYYLAMPQLAANTTLNATQSIQSKQVQETDKMRIPNIRVHVPTLVLWGENDQAFVNENLNNIEQYVPNCTIKRFHDASHWLTHEKSPEINKAIDEFINEVNTQ